MNKPPQKILVIATRRIGDVLLTTPLLHSLRQAWPSAVIDVLVFQSTAGILRGNPDVNRIVAVPERPGLRGTIQLLTRLLRKYDLALSTLTGDKPTAYAWLAGRKRIGMLDPDVRQRWKRRLLTHAVPFDNLETHTVRMNLRLAERLGIATFGKIVTTWTAADAQHLRQVLPFDPATTAYAVLHMFPKFAYKTWHAQGWIDVALWLQAHGYRVVLTGGPDADERAYVGEIRARMSADVIDLCGLLSLSESACLLASARAYVGPDTAMTHVAAGLGIPTVALYGPSNPVKWGPWPQDFDAARNPFRMHGSQVEGNVRLVQGLGTCVPCMREGCEGHIRSLSACLQRLPSERVIAALQNALAPR